MIQISYLIFYLKLLIKDDAHVEKIDETPKLNKSWLTILSIWNCMIGSSIVSVPAATKEAGIIPSLSNSFFYFFIYFKNSSVFYFLFYLLLYMPSCC